LLVMGRGRARNGRDGGDATGLLGWRSGDGGRARTVPSQLGGAAPREAPGPGPPRRGPQRACVERDLLCVLPAQLDGSPIRGAAVGRTSIAHYEPAIAGAMGTTVAICQEISPDPRTSRDVSNLRRATWTDRGPRLRLVQSGSFAPPPALHASSA